MFDKIPRHSGKRREVRLSEAHPESDPGQDGYQTVTRQARMTDAQGNRETCILVFLKFRFTGFGAIIKFIIHGTRAGILDLCWCELRFLISAGLGWIFLF